MKTVIKLQNNGGYFVLSGYETEKDLKKAGKDIERMLLVLSEMKLYDIIKFLAPYRAKAARVCQEEYDEETRKYEKG